MRGVAEAEFNSLTSSQPAPAAQLKTGPSIRYVNVTNCFDTLLDLSWWTRQTENSAAGTLHLLPSSRRATTPRVCLGPLSDPFPMWPLAKASPSALPPLPPAQARQATCAPVDRSRRCDRHMHEVVAPSLSLKCGLRELPRSRFHAKTYGQARLANAAMHEKTDVKSSSTTVKFRDGHFLDQKQVFFDRCQNTGKGQSQGRSRCCGQCQLHHQLGLRLARVRTARAKSFF